MDAEVLVIGAGPAGCAAAILLARAGRRVLLLEREAEAREIVCGEFLGPTAQAALARLGVGTEGAAPIAGVVLAHGRRVARAALPFPGLGLPRLLLDARLREAAGDVLRTGRMVREVVAIPGGWQARFGGEALSAPILMLATGKHGLRGAPPRPGRGWVGLKLHLAAEAPAAEVALLPFRGGYAGVQPNGAGLTLCAAFAPEVALPVDAAAFVALVAGASAQGAALLRDARPLWPRALAIAGLPYGHLAEATPPGLFRLGDQAAVIPSFSGEGMGLALASGLMAAEAVLAGRSAAQFQAGFATRARAPLRRAGWVAAALGRAPGLAALAAGLAPPAMAWLAGATRLGQG
ncbi:flavin-dependent dehydrogenase [Humitalea rosea]|uniref:Flavin-dependent dehydrogenase n=1 Tax=Humitalea rosea TaxID=990373 RepID=A0A2W7IMI1_9PROT|nr:FAD-dependent oxidoreductase [Humitalea rosea]PZW47045.1 flavin-dependent dehydrogenase [Humitalea rosea]